MRPPPHLSYPSSSASAYASSYVHRYVQVALASAGFTRSSGQAVNLLTEVLERYMLLLGSVAQQHANHVGRTKPCAWDAELALRELGSSGESIQNWLLDEGSDMAGQWRSLEEEDTGHAYTVDTRALEDYNERAKVPILDREPPLKLFYENVTSEQVALESLLYQDGSEQVNVETAESSPLSTPLSQSSRQLPSDHSVDEDFSRHKRKRRRSSASIVPDFLPALPSQLSSSEASASRSSVVEDADFVRRSMMLKVKEEDGLGASGESNAVEKVDLPATEDAKAEVALEDSRLMANRSVEDVWHNAVPFGSSMMVQAGQSTEDVPSIFDDSHYDDGLHGTGPTSSIRAFANDYRMLVQESRSSPQGYLTPSGGAYARVFHQRRAIAAFLTDSSKYVPCDTIFGSMGARPTELPFQPTSSMLITPPTSHNPAPTFTPLRPNGRDLPSTTVQNNALYPTCRHRNPSNVLNAARLVSGGVGTETYRRMTRIHDPDPILDEQHAERVFHGQPAPKELLIEGNSFLKAALDVLKIKRAEERAAARGGDGVGGDNEDPIRQVDMYANHSYQNGAEMDADASQLSMSATRDRIKVKSGTVVSTWDWLTREHTDGVLPGKRFRAGTVGITLGGGASSSAETTMTPGAVDSFRRHRSESIAGTPQAP